MRNVVHFMRPLVAERFSQGLSQGDIAERIGVNINTISALEGGRKETRMATIAAYAKVVGKKMEITFVDSTDEDSDSQ